MKVSGVKQNTSGSTELELSKCGKYLARKWSVCTNKIKNLVIRICNFFKTLFFGKTKPAKKIEGKIKPKKPVKKPVVSSSSNSKTTKLDKVKEPAKKKKPIKKKKTVSFDLTPDIIPTKKEDTLLKVAKVNSSTFPSSSSSFISSTSSTIASSPSSSLSSSSSPSSPSSSSSVKKVSSSQPSTTKEQIIQVPDDGNCLFYSIGLGLKMMFKRNKDIQKKLDWTHNIKKSIQEHGRDLSSTGGLLKPVSNRLRHQAADWLQENIQDEGVRNDLIVAIYFQNEKTREKITDAQTSLLLAKEELATFKKETAHYPNYETTKNLLRQGREQIDQWKKNIAIYQSQLIGENDFDTYIKRSRENGFYGTGLHIKALCEIYGIRIKVKSHYPDQIHNEDINQSTPLVIRFVNGNHYNYVTQE